MFNFNKLKSEMLLRNKSVEDLSAAIGISSPTFYRKVNNNGQFYRNEIAILARELRLSNADICEIFFAA